MPHSGQKLSSEWSSAPQFVHVPLFGEVVFSWVCCSSFFCSSFFQKNESIMSIMPSPRSHLVLFDNPKRTEIIPVTKTEIFMIVMGCAVI